MQLGVCLQILFFFFALCFLANLSTYQNQSSQKCNGYVNLTVQPTSRELPTPGCSHASNLKIMLCAMFKDIHPKDLQEWIEYHRWIGIQFFYLREHKSTKTEKYLTEYIEQGIVEYTNTNVNSSEDPMETLYKECIDLFRDQYDFIAFLDSDEYIVMQKPGLCFNSFLEFYKDQGGLAINWIQMGTSGHIERPPGATLMNYVNCDLNKTTTFNKYVKSVVNTKYVTEQLNYHLFFMKDNKLTVNEHFVGVHGHEIPEGASWDIVAVQHYQTKSLEDFKKRAERGRAGILDVYLEYETLDQHATSFCLHAQKIAMQCCSQFYIESK
eukprot:TRINITY_DN2173_c0_g1_i4.p1 TRINITY_DN2173_c0_g1~~TRINITY_DN2173_c0_g1_i4.p1  ORF type:complete len:325 (-),score=1.44 TRINITY_DN2173_c0_g1_i4:758-1732(-)